MPPIKYLPAGRGVGSSWPIIDGWVIPDDQYKICAAGRYNDLPILVGYNSDEGASFSPPKTLEDYIASVKARYGKFAEDLIKAYPVNSNSVPKTARDLTRDTTFGWHTWTWARLQARTGKSKVFYYYFDQHPEYPEGSPRAGYGSPHGADVAYVFEHLNPKSPQIKQADLEISDAMSTYWVNFAKHGDPNGEGVPAWPAFSDSNPQVMYFSQTPHPRSRAQRQIAQGSRRIFRLAPDAGRRGVGKIDRISKTRHLCAACRPTTTKWFHLRSWSA